MRIAAAVVCVGFAVGLAAPAFGKNSDPGVVNYAVMGKGSVGNIIGATLRWENFFNEPFQGYWVDIPVCNNWADIGLPKDSVIVAVERGEQDLVVPNGETTRSTLSTSSSLE